MAQLLARSIDSFAHFTSDAWTSLFSETPESLAYFRACEMAPPPSFSLSALTALDDGKPVAGAPLFKTSISLDLVLDGAARWAIRGLGKVIPSIATVPIVGIGTPYAHDSNLTFRSDLDTPKRLQTLTAMLETLEGFARRKEADIVLLKDVSSKIQGLADEALRGRGYSRITALPIARLRTPVSEAAYFTSISGNMRSNLRRRLKRAQGIRTSTEGLESQLQELRATTMKRATTDYDVFEEVSPSYYREVLRCMDGNARLLTYWLGDVLIGFSLVLLGRDKLIQTYNGMRYPEGPDNGLFYLDWMTQVRLCIDKEIPLLESGVTTYLIKARLGCEFHRSYIYVRHRNPVMNGIIRAVSPYINLEKGDPSLKELGDTAPYV